MNFLKKTWQPILKMSVLIIGANRVFRDKIKFEAIESCPKNKNNMMV